MTFYLEQRYKKQFQVMVGDQTYEIHQLNNPKVYWVFEFANGESDSIEGTFQTEGIVEFEVPLLFFSEARIGPLTWKLYIVDSDDVPTLDTHPKKDVLVRNLATASELGIS